MEPASNQPTQPSNPPSTSSSSALPPTTPTSTNANTPTPLTYNTLLLLFPTGRASWQTTHTLALTSSAHTVRALSTRVAYLTALKHQHARTLDYRRTFITSPSGVPAAYFANWHAWTAYLGRVDALCEFARQHRTWLEMLAAEYRDVEGAWEEFWALHGAMETTKGEAVEASHDDDAEDNRDEDGDRGSPTRSTTGKSQDRMQAILTRLNAHTRKRAFLHIKILEGNESEEMRAFFGDGEPEWIEWGNAS